MEQVCSPPGHCGPRGLFTSASVWMESGRWTDVLFKSQFNSWLPQPNLSLLFLTFVCTFLCVCWSGLEYSYPPRDSPLSKRFPLPPPPLSSPPPPHITCPQPIFCPQYSRSVVSDYENCFQTALFSHSSNILLLEDIKRS